MKIWCHSHKKLGQSVIRSFDCTLVRLLAFMKDADYSSLRFDCLSNDKYDKGTYFLLSTRTSSFLPRTRQLRFSKSSMWTTDLVPPDDIHIMLRQNKWPNPGHWKERGKQMVPLEDIHIILQHNKQPNPGQWKERGKQMVLLEDIHVMLRRNNQPNLRHWNERRKQMVLLEDIHIMLRRNNRPNPGQ